IPPLSGFFAKLILIKAGLEMGEYLIVAVALAVGLLTLFSMTKIWAEAFWKARPDEGGAAASQDSPAAETPSTGGLVKDRRSAPQTMYGPIVVFAAITVAIGLAGRPVFTLAEAAAGQLLAPRAYIEAVLGPQANTPS